ncbi:hypothetical protein ACGF3G_37215 [Streptomyces sp. NPDC048179]|uniref:hypothetical protein n=1 Tax=Streptomyces sp. NPDC048179 TaxID=3365506 RepID=UPI00371D668B
MIKQVSHKVTSTDPAGIALALDVAYELHAPTEATVAPTPAPRAPEVVPAPQLMGLRTSTARPHQRKVPLSRMTLVRG